MFLIVLGVDYALLWGSLAWFIGYIPSISFIIALIPPVLMAYAQYGLSTALIVLLGYVLINGGVQNFIQPKMMGQGLKINPLVVFVGLFVWGFLLGGMGAILAMPLTVLVLTLMENFDATRVRSGIDALHRRGKERGTAASDGAGQRLVVQSQDRHRARGGT